MIFLPALERRVADDRVEPAALAHLGELERPMERMAVVPDDLGHVADRAPRLDQPRLGERTQLRPRDHPLELGRLVVDHRADVARDVGGRERVGVVELRERGADDEVAEQPRVVERGVGLGEHRRLALGVEHVADDERLELVAQRERSVDGGLDLVEPEVEAGLAVPASGRGARRGAA